LEEEVRLDQHMIFKIAIIFAVEGGVLAFTVEIARFSP
jgi:hypothetical protein